MIRLRVEHRRGVTCVVAVFVQHDDEPLADGLTPLAGRRAAR